MVAMVVVGGCTSAAGRS